MTTPADVRSTLDGMKRRRAAHDLEVALRTLAWNQQMHEAMETVVAADLAGHGVIIRVSHEKNTIEAVPMPVVERHVAYVFDYDRPDSGPFRRRLHLRYTTPTQKD